jgi:hydrogenase maturation protease
MNLLHDIEGADRLLLIDAINVAQSPGTLVVLERDELPRYFGMKLSPHQIDLKEVLALAELRGTMPARTVALGLQPERIELSTSLSSALADGVPSLVQRIIQLLRDWGHHARPRNGGAARA